MKPYIEDPDLTLYNGDALEVLKTLPDESVHMCVTSPPFYGLRDYQCEGQIGLEETPEQWVEKLVGVFREVRRVLRSDGTCWVEVGDSYGANQGKGFDTHQNGDITGSRKARAIEARAHPYKQKDLIGAPWMLAFALRAEGWYLRSDIVWSRPNPMPESVTDRPTKSHSYVFLLSKSARYFFDQEAVRESATCSSRPESSRNHEGTKSSVTGNHAKGGTLGWNRPETGRNLRSVWEIPTQPYPEAHFATYPEELVRRCVLAGTSERGCCPECGAPWIRIVSDTSGGLEGSWADDSARQIRGHVKRDGAPAWANYRRGETIGWEATCSHTVSRRSDNSWSLAPCTVLDPFFGSGTTGLVARKHGRRTIGIELSEDYCRLAARRLQQLSLLAEGV